MKHRKQIDRQAARKEVLWRLRCMIDAGVPRLEEVERVIIEFAMDMHGDHRGKAAEELGMGVRTLHSKLKSYSRSEAPVL